MSTQIVSQEEEEVKQQECEVEECHEPIFRERLCWEHFCEEVIDEWDAEEPEEVDFIFGDPVDRDWFGYAKEALV